GCVGLSMDGPAESHKQYRVTKCGRPTHKLGMRALTLLQKHHVDYNVLVCVKRTSAQQQLQVYDSLCDAGVAFIQFVPV
ncbi:anaerobic sulfatase maturase AslB, partial [Escherichia coli]